MSCWSAGRCHENLEAIILVTVVKTWYGKEDTWSYISPFFFFFSSSVDNRRFMKAKWGERSIPHSARSAKRRRRLAWLIKRLLCRLFSRKSHFPQLFFFIAFPNSSFVSKNNIIKYNKTDKANCIVWFETKQHLTRPWLI